MLSVTSNGTSVSRLPMQGKGGVGHCGQEQEGASKQAQAGVCRLHVRRLALLKMMLCDSSN
jgi:hypothetical protein